MQFFQATSSDGGRYLNLYSSCKSSCLDNPCTFKSLYADACSKYGVAVPADTHCLTPTTEVPLNVSKLPDVVTDGYNEKVSTTKVTVVTKELSEPTEETPVLTRQGSESPTDTRRLSKYASDSTDTAPTYSYLCLDPDYEEEVFGICTGILYGPGADLDCNKVLLLLLNLQTFIRTI